MMTVYICGINWEEKFCLIFGFVLLQYAFDVAVISVFGNKLEELEMEGIKHLYECLEKGYNSMPLDLPGTPFHKTMKVLKINKTNKWVLFFFLVNLNLLYCDWWRNQDTCHATEVDI